MHVKRPLEFDNPLCKNDAELFFPNEEDFPDEIIPKQAYTPAKKICMMCTHRLECANWGVANEQHGVWGALDPEDLYKERKRRRRRELRQQRKLAAAEVT